MNKARLVTLMTAGLLAGSLLAPTSASAGSLCNNGTYSMNSGRGTCSWNGGVNNRYPSYSDPGSSSWNRQNGFGDPFKSNRLADPFKSSRKSGWKW